MQDLEPYYRWRDFYVTSEDELSPFYGREYSEFEYSNKIYTFTSILSGTTLAAAPWISKSFLPITNSNTPSSNLLANGTMPLTMTSCF